MYRSRKCNDSQKHNETANAVSLAFCVCVYVLLCVLHLARKSDDERMLLLDRMVENT